MARNGKDASDPMVAARLIEDMGGASAVGKACRIRSQSVCGWRYDGIPQAREQYLREVFPRIWRGVPLRAPAWARKHG